MKTLLEVLKLSADYLQQKKISHPRRQAEELLMDALQLQRLQLYLEHERPLTEVELEQCRTRLLRRGKGEPLAYIHGEVCFLDCRIKVNRHVLIPRQETEILADLIAQTLCKEDLNNKVLWDICCGSGCLGISLKKKFPQLKVILSDISKEALQIANENAKLNDVSVEILEGDCLEPFKNQKTHYLVSNPPYISELEYETLDPEVKCFEPKLALTAQDGLVFYRRFSQELPNYLYPQSKIWFELGKDQGKPIAELYQDPHWTQKEIKQDLSGHDRFFFLEFE